MWKLISEGFSFALSIQSSYTAATLTFKHKPRDSFSLFSSWSEYLKHSPQKEPGWRDSQFKPDGSSHTEQEESHAALQLQEITSVPMTQVSGECSASSVDLKHTVHSVTAWTAGPCKAVQHVAARTHTHSHTQSDISLSAALCNTLRVRIVFVSETQKATTISPCLSLPQQQLTHMHTN